jgi:hypothetical protein
VFAQRQSDSYIGMGDFGRGSGGRETLCTSFAYLDMPMAVCLVAVCQSGERGYRRGQGREWIGCILARWRNLLIWSASASSLM